MKKREYKEVLNRRTNYNKNNTSKYADVLTKESKIIEVNGSSFMATKLFLDAMAMIWDS